MIDTTGTILLCLIPLFAALMVILEDRRVSADRAAAQKA